MRPTTDHTSPGGMSTEPSETAAVSATTRAAVSSAASGPGRSARTRPRRRGPGAAGSASGAVSSATAVLAARATAYCPFLTSAGWTVAAICRTVSALRIPAIVVTSEPIRRKCPS